MSSKEISKNKFVNPENIANEVKATLKTDVIKEILTSQFQDPKTKLGNDVAALMADVMKTLVTEVTLRSSVQVLRDENPEVCLEHVEKCLPQILLDFP